MTTERINLHWLLWLCVWSLGASAAVDTNRGLLWRIERAGSTVGYLFGTVHSDDPRVLALPEPVERAFDDSDTVVLETGIDDDATQAAAQAMFLPPGDTLAKHLGEPLTDQALAVALRHGLAREVAARSKPWALAVTLSTPLMRTGQFLDLLLQTRARERGKPVLGLETIAEQFGVFEALSDDEQITLLRDTLANYDQLARYFDELITSYLARDLAGLERLSEQYLDRTSPMQQKLLQQLVDERNIRMAARIETMLKKNSRLFIAIGALHLPGAQGLVNLLDRAGYRLTPLY